LGSRKGIQLVKNIGIWWRWALVSPDGVAPSRKKGHKTVVVVAVVV